MADNSTLTLAEIQADVYANLDEISDGTGFFNDAEITALANEAQFRLNLLTECVWTLVTRNVYKNQTYFELPDDTLRVKRVFYEESGSERVLDWETWGFLDDNNEGWESDSWGIPDYFFLYDVNKKLYMDKPFQADTTIQIDYVQIPAALSLSTDISTLDSSLHDCIVLFCMYKLMIKEMDSSKIAEAKSYLGEFYSKATEFKKPSLKRKRGRQSRLG